MLDITQLDEQAVEVLNEIIKSGNISEIDLGAKLVQFDFSQEELEDITKYLEQQGVTIEEGMEDLLKDDDLKDIVNNIKIDDPVKLYLKDIGGVSLLTSEQEIELAKRILQGD